MNEVIEHHGILGMKWGVRRTPAQLGRATGSKKNSDDSNSSGQRKSNPSTATKKTSNMTDEELRSKVNRLNMEKQYRDLDASLNPKRKSVAKKLLGEAAENLGRQTLSKIVSKIVEKAFDKKEGFDAKDFDFKDTSKINQEELSKAVKWFSSEKSYRNLKQEYDISHKQPSSAGSRPPNKPSNTGSQDTTQRVSVERLDQWIKDHNRALRDLGI